MSVREGNGAGSGAGAGGAGGLVVEVCFVSIVIEAAESETELIRTAVPACVVKVLPACHAVFSA